MTLLLYHGGVPAIAPPPTVGVGVPVLVIRELSAARLTITEPPEVRLSVRRLDS